MINEADIYRTDDLGRSISHFACAGGNFEIIFLLHGIDLNLFNYKDLAGNSCIYYSLMFRHPSSFFWLWDVIDLAVSELNSMKISPLHIAVANDQIDILDFSCQHGCSMNQRNERGDTPLHYAAQKSNSGLSLALLSHGAFLSIQNNFGCCPSQLAKSPYIQAIMLEYPTC